MRLLASCAVLLASFNLAAAAVDGLSDYIENVPDCAFDAFRSAMEDHKCEVDKVDGSSFECLCDHMSAIIVAVTKELDTECLADFSQAVGGACGNWMLYDTTASDFPQATSILADELNGGGSDAKPTTTSGPADSNAGDAAETSTAEDAAFITQAPHIAGMMGGAAVVLAGLVI